MRHRRCIVNPASIHFELTRRDLNFFITERSTERSRCRGEKKNKSPRLFVGRQSNISGVLVLSLPLGAANSTRRVRRLLCVIYDNNNNNVLSLRRRRRLARTNRVR